MGLFSDSDEKKNQKVRTSLTSTMRKKLKDAVAKCEKCKRKGDLDIHHLKPIAKGGDNTPSNLVALCPNCHRDCHNGSTTQKDLKKVVKKRTDKVKKEFASILKNRKKVEGRDVKERGLLKKVVDALSE